MLAKPENENLLHTEIVKGTLHQEPRTVSAEPGQRSSTDSPALAPPPLPSALPAVEDVSPFLPVEMVTAQKHGALGRVRTAARVAGVVATRGQNSPAETTHWLDDSAIELQTAYSDPFSIGADVEVFSRSQGCWVAAKVVEEEESGIIRVLGQINGHNLRKSVRRDDCNAVCARFQTAALQESIVDKDTQIVALIETLNEALIQLGQGEKTVGATLTANTADQHRLTVSYHAMQRLAIDHAGVTQTLSMSIKELSQQLREEKALVEHCMKTVQQMETCISAGQKENQAQKLKLTKVFTVAIA